MIYRVGIKDNKGTELKVGDTIKGIGDHKGQSEIFIGDAGEIQPFDYLNDYNGKNYVKISEASLV